MHKSFIRRREALKAIAGAGLVPVIARMGSTAASAEEPLRVFDFAGYEVPDLHQPYIKKYGASPAISIFADGEEAFVKLRGGFQTDVVHLGTFDVERMRDADLIQPWDPSRLAHWKDVFPYFNTAPGTVADGKQWMIPVDWGYDSILYRTDLADVSEESWTVLWDQRFKGKVGYGTELYPAIAGAALALGIKDPFHANDEQFEQIRKKLVELRDVVKFFWTDPTSIEQAMASGEVVVAWTWSSSYKALKSQGIPVKLMQKPKEGVSSWIAGFCRLKNSSAGQDQQAYDYVDAWLAPETGKWLIENYSYASTNQKAFELVDPAILADVGLSTPLELLKNSLPNEAMSPKLHDHYARMFPGSAVWVLTIMSAGDLGPNRELVGRVGSRVRLNTPALILDLDAFQRNMAVMSARVKKLGVKLRPHAKAHKSGAVGRRQVEAGAIGISCATLDEAEAMVRGGVSSVLVTSPVVDPAAIDRLMMLASKADEVMTVVDHPANVEALAAHAREMGVRLGALVDVDVGQHRTGVTSVKSAVNLAEQIRDSGALQYRGLQAYYGHLQHVHAYADRDHAVEQALETLRATIKALNDAELVPGIVSGSGTGTHLIDAHAGVHTELQPGSYIFMDRQYNGVEIAPGNAPSFEQALFVRTTVVSVNQPGLAVVHGGWKAFATESDVPLVHRGAPGDAKYQFMGDEHGGLRLPAGSPELKLGSVVELIPPHCDPTVNLFNRFHCVRGDDLVDIWPIEARGY